MVFFGGLATAQIDNVSPSENIHSVTMVDPAPTYDPDSGTWYYPQLGQKPPVAAGTKKDPRIMSGTRAYPAPGDDPRDETPAAEIGFGYSSAEGGLTDISPGNEIENFGIPLLAYPQTDEEAPSEIEIRLNAINSSAVEVICLGMEASLENWTITANNRTVYVFPKVILATGEKYGAKMAISDSAIIKLFDENGAERDSAEFFNKAPNLLYHRVLESNGAWQWIMGMVAIGPHY